MPSTYNGLFTPVSIITNIKQLVTIIVNLFLFEFFIHHYLSALTNVKVLILIVLKNINS